MYVLVLQTLQLNVFPMSADKTLGNVMATCFIFGNDKAVQGISTVSIRTTLNVHLICTFHIKS